MKVLLIRPGITLSQRERFSMAPPLGLAYIAAFLEPEGHSVEIVDCIASSWRKPISIVKDGEGLRHYGPTENELADIIRRSKPDLVGVSCLASMYAGEAHRVAKVVKNVDKYLEVVLGGVHPSALPRETLDDPNVDYVVIGEGEETATELVNRLERSEDVSTLDGFAFKRKGRTVVNSKTKFIEDLDAIPLPARHLLPMEEYFKSAKTVASHGGTTGIRSTSMITSRGCPGRCIFCSNHIRCGGTNGDPEAQRMWLTK